MMTTKLKKQRTTKVLLGVITLIIAAVFALPSIASAQESADPTIEGKGWLYARGTGVVDIDMGGQIRVRLNGDVSITDHAGDMRYQVRGQSSDDEAFRSGDVVLTDHDGFVRVRGSDFSISIDGEVVLAARGEGQAYLDGDGTYRTRNGDRTVWDGMVVIGGTDSEAAA